MRNNPRSIVHYGPERGTVPWFGEPMKEDSMNNSNEDDEVITLSDEEMVSWANASLERTAELEAEKEVALIKTIDYIDRVRELEADVAFWRKNCEELALDNATLNDEIARMVKISDAAAMTIKAAKDCEAEVERLRAVYEAAKDNISTTSRAGALLAKQRLREAIAAVQEDKA
jgi:hypothetical protein